MTNFPGHRSSQKRLIWEVYEHLPRILINSVCLCPHSATRKSFVNIIVDTRPQLNVCYTFKFCAERHMKILWTFRCHVSCAFWECMNGPIENSIRISTGIKLSKVSTSIISVHSTNVNVTLGCCIFLSQAFCTIMATTCLKLQSITKCFAAFTSFSIVSIHSNWNWTFYHQKLNVRIPLRATIGHKT